MDNSNKLPAGILEILRRPMPDESLSQVPGGAKLTSIKSMYVIERLNEAFGIGRWSLDHEVVEATESEIVVGGKLHLIDYPECQFPATYGSMKGRGNTERGDMYKGAVTACIGKAASFLEIGIDVFKGKVKAPSGGGYSQPYKPAAQEPPKEQPTKIDNLTPDLLRKMGWNKKFYGGKAKDLIYLVGKNGQNKPVKLDAMQKEMCELFAEAKEAGGLPPTDDPMTLNLKSA